MSELISGPTPAPVPVPEQMPGRADEGRPSVVCVSGRRVVQVLAQLDVRTVLLGDPTPLDLACVVDVPMDLDLDDWTTAEAALRRLHATHPVEAVLSVYDAHLPLASFLAARLDVTGLALAAALNCHDKLRMRLALQAADIPGPAYAVVADEGEAHAAARRIGHPVLLKKITAAAGRGTRLCRDPDEVAEAVTALREESSPNLLVEEYVDGPEYAVQSVTAGGVTEVISILSQHTAPGPRPLEVGYDFPSGLGERGEHDLGRFVAKALRALGFDDGIAHTQVRLGPAGPMVVNVGARPPGGLLCAITEAVCGVDMVRAAAEVALGRPVTRRAPTARYARYRCVTFEASGRVAYDPRALTDARQQAPSPVVSMDVDPGEAVLALDHPDGGTYGRVVVYADTEARLEPAYRRILDTLRPHIDQATT
ncbi:ATP-grasp domain-containing protein [Streptosporangium sp. NPDC023963]|uniref:ATP-grasp domain-containing protein n=1 Tax=Streptosporangium sp. NPDC023963 TaxID=3155608 RepID=UPI00341C41C6